MTKEHRKFIRICEKIGYKIDNKKYNINYNGIVILINCGGDHCAMVEYKINVKEIIFTTEFINKYEEYIKSDKCKIIVDVLDCWDLLLHEHLDNPLDYLYNLIFKEDE